MFVSKRMLRYFKVAGLLGVILFSSGWVAADIYKWVDENGKTHYSDAQPKQEKVEVVTPEIQNTYTKPAIEYNELFKYSAVTTQSRKKVVMYSAVWCGVCKKARQYFQANKIAFSEYDIETSKKGQRDYEKLKGRGVPIILVGKKRLNGFTAASFKQVYQ